MPKTILLADDSVTIQKVVELTFMDQDFEVVAVGDGHSALAKLEELMPDMVVADVHMPGADGYEVCRRTKAMNKDIPVLLLVGTFEPFDQQLADSAGADASLKKPFDSQELLRRVEEFTKDTEELVVADDLDEKEPQLAEGQNEVGGKVDKRLDEPADLELVDDASDFRSIASFLEPKALGMEMTREVPVIEEADSDSASEEPERVAAAAAERLDATEPESESMVPSSETKAIPRLESSRSGENRLSNGGLSPDELESLAKRVADLLSDKVIREVAWEVVPDLAEVIIKERIRELESQVE